jgi:hypothetical protein
MNNFFIFYFFFSLVISKKKTMSILLLLLSFVLLSIGISILVLAQRLSKDVKHKHWSTYLYILSSLFILPSVIIMLKEAWEYFSAPKGYSKVLQENPDDVLGARELKQFAAEVGKPVISPPLRYAKKPPAPPPRQSEVEDPYVTEWD